MQVKTSELTGKALDYAVALCEGVEVTQWDNLLWYYNKDCEGICLYQPSEMWVIAGPIIERERVCTEEYDNGYWQAHKGGLFYASGDTPLIAATRCYVASKLGSVVDIPYELL